MASKRQRDETQIHEEQHMNEDHGAQELKRQKSYNQIVSLLDQDQDQEEQPIEDLSSIITTLQQEIICSPHDPQSSQQINADPSNFSDSSSSSDSKEEEEERERVMRHLLEASDDELGIVPSGDFFVEYEEQGGGGGGGGVSLCDALWELEDEAANYYTLFQSQLFM